MGISVVAVGLVKKGVWWMVEDARDSSYPRVNKAFYSKFGVVKFFQHFNMVIVCAATDTGSFCCHDFDIGLKNGIRRKFLV